MITLSSCAQCEELFADTSGQPRRLYCSQRCRWRAKNARRGRPGGSRESYQATRTSAAAARASARRLGTSCRLTFRTCDIDGALFVARRGSLAKRCSAACRREFARRESLRLYARPDDPRRSAYWRVVASPEAVALARKHRELRDQVRQLTFRVAGGPE